MLDEWAHRMKALIGVDIRERLTSMQKAPGMCAITREGFLVQVMTWLLVAGVDTDDVRALERAGVSKSVPSSLVDVEHLMTKIQIPTDAWANDLIDKALVLIPDPCVVDFSRSQSVETQSVETQSVETQSVETQSVETQSVETQRSATTKVRAHGLG